MEARAPVPHGARRAPLEGRLAPHRLPRHDDGRALDQRHPRAARAVRAARARTSSTCGTRTATTGRPTRPRPSSRRSCSTDLEESIVQAGPETVAMVIFEPVQNAGGSFTPPAGYFQGVREICDRYGILLCADEVITGFGRTGAWFASEQVRHRARPDHVREGPVVELRRDRRGARRRQGRRGVQATRRRCTRTASPSAGIRSAARSRSRTSRSCSASRSSSTSREKQDDFRDQLATLLELDIVGDVRGTGYLWALELVKDKETRETFQREESRDAAARLPVAGALRARADLPRRRPRRSGRADLAAAHRR